MGEQAPVRLLTRRERATVRAALRLWIEMPSMTMPASVFLELGDDPPLLPGAAVEALIAAFAAGDVQLLGGRFITPATDADPRRI